MGKVTEDTFWYRVKWVVVMVGGIKYALWWVLIVLSVLEGDLEESLQ